MYNVTSGKLLHKIGWASVGCTLALGLASTGMAGAAEPTSDFSTTWTCTSVSVTSHRHDLSNVVLDFADGEQKYDGLSGMSGSFAGTGEHAGDTLLGAWVKAGNNGSGDGPGYGQWIPSSATCGSSAATTGTNTSGGSSNGGTSNGGTSKGVDSNGTTAEIAVDFDCESVVVTSSKDISNVVIVLSDGTHIKFDNLSGREWDDYEAPEGLTIVAVYVKSGSNHSGDGPGYGEKVVTDADCDDATTTGTTPNTNTGGNTGNTGSTNTNTNTNTSTGGSSAANDTPAAPAILASLDVPEAAVLGTSIAGEKVAAAPRGAEVLGVTIQRPAVAGGANVAPAALALTGLDLSSLVLASGGLITSGAFLLRRSRRPQ